MAIRSTNAQIVRMKILALPVGKAMFSEMIIAQTTALLENSLTISILLMEELRRPGASNVQAHAMNA